MRKMVLIISVTAEAFQLTAGSCAVPATLEIKSFNSFFSDLLQPYFLLFFSPSIWKIGRKGCNIRYREQDPMHASTREHTLFIVFEAATLKMEIYLNLLQRGRHNRLVPTEAQAFFILPPALGRTMRNLFI